MSLTTQLIRRISKYFTVSQRPTVPPIGTNHIDDALAWGDTGIYRGELVIDLPSGKVFTSDGLDIIELNKTNSILSGMRVKQPELSLIGIALDLTIESGLIIINGRTYEHFSNDPNSDIQIVENTSATNGRIDLIYAESDYPAFGTSFFNARFGVQTILTGSRLGSNPDNLTNQLLNYQFEESSDRIPIALVYVPNNYNVNSNHSLRPISAGGSDVSYPFNSSNPVSFFSNYLRGNRTWESDHVYFYGQILSFGNSLYSVANIHISSNITTDVLNGDLIPISGGSDVSGSGFIDVFSDVGLTGGFPTDGSWTNDSPAINSWTPSTKILDAFDELNTILGKIIPAQPPNLSSVNLNLSNIFTANAEGTTNTFNNVTYDTTPTMNISEPFGNADSGTLEAVVNSSSVSLTLTSASESGTYTNGGARLTLVDQDYANFAGISISSGFHNALSGSITAAVALSSSNTAYIYQLTHTDTGSVNNTVFVDDNLRPSVVINSVIAPLGTIRYISGVPTLSAGDTINADITVNNAISFFYNSTRIANLNGNNVDSLNAFTPSVAYAQFSSVNGTSSLLVSNNVYNENTEIIVTGYNARGTQASDISTATSSVAIRVDTISDESTRLSVGSGQFPSAGYTGVYDSSEELNINEALQLLGNEYVYPTGNYSNNLPVAGPDYSAITGYRYAVFNLGSVTNAKQITFTFDEPVNIVENGSGGVVTNNMRVYLRVEGQTGWVDINQEYIAGSPVNDGDAAFAVGAGDAIHRVATFGATFSGYTGELYIRVGLNTGSSIRFSGISLDSVV